MTRAAVAIAGLSLLAALCAPAAVAAPCTVLNHTFQPDCFRAAGDTTCVFDRSHPDFGPQIAVWLESADGTQFVDTLMVTNAVAIHGIGNRPGTWNLLSGPRFPYGRRPMALPIWAHARRQLYPFVAMNDGMEDELVNHENTSSPERSTSRSTTSTWWRRRRPSTALRTPATGLSPSIWPLAVTRSPSRWPRSSTPTPPTTIPPR